MAQSLLNRNILFWSALLAACAPVPAFSAEPASVPAIPADVAAATRLVDQGRADFQAAPLNAAEAAMEACASDPERGFDCAIQAARAGLYLSFVHKLAGHPDQARFCVERAIPLALEAARRRPGSALVHVLLAELYGRRALLGGAFGLLRYGPLNGSQVAEAVRLAPDDPQVLEAQGLRYLYAPAIVGGSAAKARACLERALKSDDSDWTRYYLALTLRKLGKPEAARQELLQAHAMNPDNGLVNAALKATRGLRPPGTVGGS